MNFNNLLEYQKADIALKRLQDEISAHPDGKRMKELRDEFAAAKKKVSDSESLAGTVVSTYHSALEYLKKKTARIDEIATALTTDSADDESFVAELESLRNEIGEWEKKVAALKSSADKALRDFTEAQASGKKAREGYNEAKQKFEQYRIGRDEEVNALKAELARIEKSVAPEHLALYKSITSENRYPAFVPALGDKKNPSCSCGMMLSDAAKKELARDGYCRCETCRRAIYSPDEK